MKHAPHGLAHDLPHLIAQAQRRRVLRQLGSGLIATLPWTLLACGGGTDDDNSAAAGGTGGSTGGAAASGSCALMPNETAGPYPADGTNSNAGGVVNALTLSGIVRSDIRTSVGGASGTAPGVPLTVTLRLVNTSGSCTGLGGYAVYLWHCTRDGNYSLYSSGYASENFLRGVQVSDNDGNVTFTTIFPGCYSGRWPHIHFEVYGSLAGATSGNNDIKTSQLALPAAACSQVYGVVSGYNASAANFGAVSLASDNVFGNDGALLQLASVSGDATGGFTATLQVGL